MTQKEQLKIMIIIGELDTALRHIVQGSPEAVAAVTEESGFPAGRECSQAFVEATEELIQMRNLWFNKLPEENRREYDLVATIAGLKG